MSKKQQLDLVVPPDQNLSELLASFQTRFHVKTLPEFACRRLFYDTFDWLIYNSGAELEVREEQQNRRIYWRADANSRPRIQLGLSEVPQLARDLPESDFRRQLESVITVRELMPRISMRIRRRPLVVLDQNDEVAVRLSFDEHRYYPSTTAKGTILGKRITIRAVKGQRKAFSDVEAYFQPMQPDDGHENMVALALAESGASPSEYSSKLDLRLEPGMPANQALKHILLRLLEIMQQNTAGCMRGVDTEFLHDYRVAIRKTRSALTQIEQVLPGDITDRYNKFFSGLGKLTNPIRDLDVFRLKLESYRQKLKKSMQDDLAPLRQYLAQTRDAAQKKFVKTLQSDDYRASIEAWRDFLASTEPLQPPLENTARPAGPLASELIWNMYWLALEEGNAITDATGAEALHELRKTCKKLRYLMEFFQSLYPADRILALIQAMKGLQDNLGEYNDLHVHAGILEKFVKTSPDACAESASRSLIKKLKKKQAKTRTDFAGRYAAFASGKNQREFRNLFGAPSTQE